MTHHTRIVSRGVLLAALSLCALVALPAAAQATVVQNACQYNFDNYYRNMDIGIGGSATIVAAPTASVVDAGQKIQLSGAPLSVVLPKNLPEFGYRAGYLHDGFNSITVNVWVAIKATNTAEGTQIQGPFTLNATTTIMTEPSDGSFLGDTGFSYTTPTLAASNWTAAGGDVVFSQGAPGALGQLPVGNGGAARTVKGSVVIQAVISPTISFFMDCQPGATQDVNPADEAGPSFLATTPVPIDSHITGRPGSGGAGGGAGGGGAGGTTPGGGGSTAQPGTSNSTPGATAIAGAIDSGKLVLSANRTKLVVTCPKSALAGCKGTLSVRSLQKLRVTPRGKAKIITIARDAKYTLAAGKRRTITLALGADAKRVLHGRRSLKVRITLKPKRGATVTRAVTLSR